MKDYYYVLGVSRNANKEEIKTAFRKLSKKFHPDLNDGDKFFEERFKEIQTAYETLNDFTKKSSYDIKLNNYNYSKKQDNYTQNTYAKSQPSDNNTEKSEYKNSKSVSSNKIILYFFLAFVGFLSLILIIKKIQNGSINNESIEQNEDISEKSISELNKKWLNGEFSAIIEQFDINEKWSMKLRINNEKDNLGNDIQIFNIDYPSLDCGGEWIIVSETTNKVEFKEKLTYGYASCIDSGNVIIEKKGKQFFISFYLPYKSNIYAKGELFQSDSKLVNDHLIDENSNEDEFRLSSKSKYYGNQLENGDSPLDNCFGKGLYQGSAYLIFKNSNLTDAVVCLVRKNDKKTIRNEYIRAGADFKMSKIPSGNYFIKVYYGNDWNPEKINFCNIYGAFENNIHFSKSDKIGDMITIENSSNSYTTGSITLYTVENGNMSSEIINESDFFQD
jgi:curved DNA-binding protein CbpA